MPYILFCVEKFKKAPSTSLTELPLKTSYLNI